MTLMSYPVPHPLFVRQAARQVLLGLILAGALGTTLGGEARQVVLLVPGTTAESSAVLDSTASEVKEGARWAPRDGGWTYRVWIPPGARAELSFGSSGNPQVLLTDNLGAKVACKTSVAGNTTTLGMPAAARPGDGGLRLRFVAADGPISVQGLTLILGVPDRAGDGLGDVVEGLMGADHGKKAILVPRPPVPHTAFFYYQPYDPSMAVPVDSVQLYGWTSATSPALYSTWALKGYDVQSFLHSRYGRELRDVAEEDQMAQGNAPIRMMSVKKDGKGIFLEVVAVTEPMKAEVIRHYGAGTTLEFDNYKLPTPERIELAKTYYIDALKSGISTFCFDEPEIWAQAGYAPAFRREWEPLYGSPWEAPDSSVEARYKADQLKAFMLRRWVETILSDVQQRNPTVRRMMALHSPINYYKLRMATPHNRLFSIPEVQDVIAEVWNDPFDESYLEYSSFWNLARGRDQRLWFMMDPWGDSPAISLDFYRRSYGENLLAALMFPQIDTYQPLIWPNRLFGSMPRDYEVIINAVTGALTEMWRYPHGALGAGSGGIGTFIADSMGWQRAEPSPSDLGGFYGISSSLVRSGIPVEVLSLDRADEPGYLDGVKCLLVSYDFLKPMRASLNRAIADWTRRGGSLVVCGGSDAYNAVSDSWWRKAGFASPMQELFSELGLGVGEPTALSRQPANVDLVDASAAFGPGLARVKVPFGPSVGEADFQNEKIGTLNFVDPTPGPRSYPITLCAAPVAGTTLYTLPGESSPVSWEAAVGKGSVIFEGVAPGFFHTSLQGAAWVRAIAARAMAKAGQTYREQPFFRMRRGPYTAVRALGAPYTEKGRFVDLLSQHLDLLEDPVVAAGQCAFWIDAGPADNAPRLLAAAGRVRATFGDASTTSFLVQAPSQTPGVARVWLGQRTPTQVKAFTVLGTPVPETFSFEGGSLLVRYDNDADGVIVRVRWK